MSKYPIYAGRKASRFATGDNPDYQMNTLKKQYHDIANKSLTTVSRLEQTTNQSYPARCSHSVAPASAPKTRTLRIPQILDFERILADVNRRKSIDERVIASEIRPKLLNENLLLPLKYHVYDTAANYLLLNLIIQNPEMKARAY